MAAKTNSWVIDGRRNSRSGGLSEYFLQAPTPARHEDPWVDSTPFDTPDPGRAANFPDDDGNPDTNPY